MLIYTNVPDWADELIKEVCKDHRRVIPSVVKWRNYQSRKFSSGTTWTPGGRTLWSARKLKDGTIKRFKSDGEIHISAGYDEMDQRLVLLHELAHHLVGRSKRQGHTRAFWDKAFELYQKYGVGTTYAYGREKSYKVKATDAYQRIREA